MRNKRGRQLKETLEWVAHSKEPVSTSELPEVYSLIDWYNKQLGIGILAAIEVLASYSPRRLEELDAQRQMEEGE